MFSFVVILLINLLTFLVLLSLMNTGGFIATGRDFLARTSQCYAATAHEAAWAWHSAVTAWQRRS